MKQHITIKNKGYLTLIIFFLSGTNIWAQQLRVNFSISTSQSLENFNDLQQLIENGNIQLRITNLSNQNQNFFIDASLTSNDIDFKIETDLDQSEIVRMNANESRIFGTNELQNLFSERNLVFSEPLDLVSGALLPEDIYDLCIKLRPINNPENVISNIGCESLTFFNNSAPLITLINNTVCSGSCDLPVLSTKNQPLTISFLTPRLGYKSQSLEPKLEIKIFETNEGDDPNQDFMALENLIEPSRFVYNSPVLNLSKSEITVEYLLPEKFIEPLKLGREYAVIITNGLISSPICRFKYGQRIVIRRPHTGRIGLDSFIDILNELDSPEKSVSQLLNEAISELGKSKVTMRANKVCYSIPNAVNCIKLDSLYDAKYPNRGVNNLMKLVTNDLANDLGQGDAFNVCGNGTRGSVKGLSMQRVGNLTAGMTANIQKPSSQSITDQIMGVCGESEGADGGDRGESSSECTDCYIDKELANIIATGSIDQLNPIVQAINEFCAIPRMGDISQGHNGQISNGTGENSSQSGNASGDTELTATEENGVVTFFTAEVAEQTGNSAIVGATAEFIDRGTNFMGGTFDAMDGAWGDVAGSVGQGIINFASNYGSEEVQIVATIGDATVTVAEGAALLTKWGTSAVYYAEFGSVGAFEGAAALGGLVLSTVGVLAGVVGLTLWFSDQLDNEQAAREERVRQSNEYYRNRNGALKLTLDDTNKSLREKQKEMYEIKKSFGRLGWGEVFIGNGGGGSDPTGAGQVSSGSGRNPLTGDMSTFVCSMVDKCNQDGWDTEGCRGFMQSFNCVKGVDSRMIYTDPDAFADGRGCGASGNPKFRCAEEAVGQPAPGSENNDPCNKFARNRNSLKDFGPNIGPENTTPIDPDIIDLPGKDGSKNPKPDPRSFEVPKDLQNQMPARPNFNPKPKPQNSTKDLPKNKERYD